MKPITALTFPPEPDGRNFGQRLAENTRENAAEQGGGARSRREHGAGAREKRTPAIGPAGSGAG